MLCLFIIIAIFITSLVLGKRIIHPVTILSLVWGIIMGLYQLNISSFNEISANTYFIIGSGIVAFAAGFCIFKATVRDKRIVIGNFRTLKENEELYGEHIKYGFVGFLCISSIIVLLPEAINSFKILASGGTFETLRTNYSNGYSALNISTLSLYRNYIVKPFCYIIYPLCAIDFIKGEKKRWLFVSTFVLAFLSTLYEGGRVQFVYLAIYFALIFILAGYQINIPKKVKKILSGLIILMAVVVAYITSSRGSSSTFSQSILLYVSGCVPLLDAHLNSFDFRPEYTYGLVAISGFLKPLFSLLENVGIPYPIFLTNIQHVFEVEQTISIGSVFHMNAYVSIFYYLFYDGGYIGNVIEMFLYGGLAWLIYRRTTSIRGMLYYALFFHGLVFSMIRFQFTISHYCLAFIMAYFLFEKVPDLDHEGEL
ncbi:O-antigen polysaccharide polymerase Wzy [Ruminococcus sp. AM27-16]|nr:O-antigen polysaccharide polymerase Wzy [Ruminococcus sp. AM27-16]